MTTLNDLHGKVPPPPVHVVALGFNGPWEVQTMKVKLAICLDRNVADYIAALWNLMPPVVETPSIGPNPLADPQSANFHITPDLKPRSKWRRRKAGKSVQVVP